MAFNLLGPKLLRTTTQSWFHIDEHLPEVFPWSTPIHSQKGLPVLHLGGPELRRDYNA